MGTQVTLKAERREGKGKGVARKLRQRGRLPAVLYGAGADPISISLNAHDTLHLFSTISIENTIVNLEVEGEKGPVPTLIREVQAHSYRPDLVHVDFLRVQTGVAVELDIPVHLIGTPKGVRDSGGVLEQSIHELPVSCIPSAIPESFDVDVSGLDVGESIHLSELEMPEGVELMMDGERTICSVQAPSVSTTDTEDDEEEEGEEAQPERVGETDEAEEV